MTQRIIESENFYYNLDKQIIITKGDISTVILDVEHFIKNQFNYKFDDVHTSELINLIFWEDNKPCKM